LCGTALVISKIQNKTAVSLLAILLLLSVLPVLKLNYYENDKSKNFICHDYGINLLRSPVPGSVVFVSGDNGTFGAAYFKFVEKARPDIEVYDDYGRVFKNIYGADFLFMPAGVYNKRVTQVQRDLLSTTNKPVYCLRDSNIYGMEDVPKINEGLLYRIKSARAPVFPFQATLTTRGIDGKAHYLDYFCKELSAGYYMLEGDRQLERQGQEAAKVYYKKAAEITGSPEILNTLGVAYYKKGLYDQSIAAYEDAVKMDPAYFKSYFNIGVSYNAKNEPAKALEYFEKTLQKSPSYVEAYYGAANCYFYRKEYEKAFKYYVKATEINPEFAIAFNGAAAAMHSIGKYPEAVKYYEKALEIKPDYLEAYGNLVSAYQALGQKAGAVRTLKRALNYFPENAGFRQQLKNLGE
ncbi:MAG: tetratricopeptide repeat protein, partial [Candidatus Firestonebacteria bacterium]